MVKRLFILFIVLITEIASYAQSNNATLRGVVRDDAGNLLDMVHIGLKDYPLGTSSNREGKYLLRIPAEKPVVVIFSSIGYQTYADTLTAAAEADITLNVTLPAADLKLAEVTVTEIRRNSGNITRMDSRFLDVIPDAATGGVEALIKTLPGVSSNNELSSQYTVRGGNFDENMVYVNDIEIYRPFLVRSGQQEGLSFINSDMVSTIEFSAGGFDARYGDKMSSVLDIKYRKPSEFRGSASISMLGASAHFEDVAAKGKIAHISAIRYKTNEYLLGGLDEMGEYDPKFIDFQTYITFHLSEKFDLSLLGNIASNNYRFIPQTRKTSFGTWQTPLNTTIYFQGQEVDKFNTSLGALSANYHPNLNLNLKFTVSAFHTSEEETFDILGDYYLNQLERNMSSEAFGDSVLNLGVGTFLNHARNYLDANVFSISHRGAYNSEKHLLNWGVQMQHERFTDKINEWIYRDSTGYSLPYSDRQVLLYFSLNAKNRVGSNRITGHFQDTWGLPVSSGDLYLTSGLRFNYWDFNQELLVSPRVSMSYYPDWQNKMSFRISGGLYHQSPFIKELKNSDGSINRNAKAQRSWQLVMGTDYLFTAWDRPFRFSAEAYYKLMNRLIPYKIDNVRIRYLGEQEAKGYARGVDMKVNGEFVSGVQSWASISFMKTEEDIRGDDHWSVDADGNRQWVNQGYIPRPTDQWMNFSLFFQDYFPGNPSYKMQLSGFFGSRLPTGPPKSERYQDQFRMPAYRRIDMGLSKVIISPARKGKKGVFRHVNDLWVSLEVFNLLNIKNTISYFWVSSIYGDQFAIPNYLTDRKINLKMTVKF